MSIAPIHATPTSGPVRRPFAVCSPFTDPVQALEHIASMLGVGAGEVDAMLTQRVVTTRGETFTKQLGVQDSSRSRDAIVKALYEARAWDGVAWHPLGVPPWVLVPAGISGPRWDVVRWPVSVSDERFGC